MSNIFKTKIYQKWEWALPFIVTAMIVLSCRETKPDGSLTWNTKQLMKKNPYGVVTGKRFIPFHHGIDSIKTVVKK